MHSNGQAIRSCLTPISAAVGQKITTIEAVTGGQDKIGHALHTAWVKHDVAQCGYYQSGQIMSASAFLMSLAKGIQPNEDEIDAAMAGNICRCGTQELLELPVSKLFGHQLADLIVFTQAVMDKGRGWTEELSCNCKSGERIELEISATTLHIKGEQHLILVLRELSHEKLQRDQAHTERTMRGGLIEWRNILNLFQESWRDNQLLLSSLGDGIYSINSEGLATFVNPAGVRMLGWDPQDMIGKNIQRIHHHTHADGSHYPVEECPIYKAVRDCVVHEGRQEVFWRRDGSSFPVELTSTR